MSTPRPRPDQEPAANIRPPIWINGRQRPSFDLRAYGAYSLIATRAALGPLLASAAATTGGLQTRIAAGAYPINTARLGRAADYLPRRASIAATIGGFAGVLAQTGQVISPPPPEPESLAAYDALWRTRKPSASGRLRGVDLDDAQSDPDLHALRQNQPMRPQRQVRQIVVAQAVPLEEAATHVEVVAPEPVRTEPTLVLMPQRAAPEAAPEEATVLAIRNLFAVPDNAAPPEPLTPARAQVAPDTKTAAQAHPTAPARRLQLPGWLKAILHKVLHQIKRAFAFCLAWGLIVLAMPYGLTKAAIAHLEGRDLRDLVEDP